METYELSKHVVAYIDLLGMKKFIKYKPNGLALTMHDVYTLFNELVSRLPDHAEIKVKIFSDNIIITRRVTESIENQRANLHQIIGLVEAFQLDPNFL